MSLEIKNEVILNPFLSENRSIKLELYNSIENREITKSIIPIEYFFVIVDSKF
ncbi:hypothetical protein HNQ03_001102 [Chryseobacterium sp. 16F]|uniref:Uncharacterized protein n=1 Tax=Frigoriflavimonas asaccharolytica TaxID=2735899 RepID=A0A8J8G9Y7_9FLAO|nr:hypothetical protein [Frigoriflavimonas asaccharolytica]